MVLQNRSRATLSAYERKHNKTKQFDCKLSTYWCIPDSPSNRDLTHAGTMLKTLLLLLLIPCELLAQERQVVPTWVHRYVPSLSGTQIDLPYATLHSQALMLVTLS